MKHLLFSTALLILLFTVCTTKLFAVKAYPYPTTIIQPDGTELEIQLQGDEFKRMRTTSDGYLIKKNEKGFYTYAVQDEKKRIVAGSVIARNINDRKPQEQTLLRNMPKANELTSQQVSGGPKRVIAQKAPLPAPKAKISTIGTLKSLVILVNFSDVPFSVPTPEDAFYRLLNQEGYSDNQATGSARDYFRSSSNGLFDPQFDVVGPYTLPQTMAFYGTNDEFGFDINPTQMAVEACIAADKDVDFSAYDTNNDGYIDNVFIYYSGYNEAEYGPVESIWPHRWVVFPGNNYEGTWESITFDGKRLFDYACTSELRSNSGTNICGIGTFAHEFGHVIGMPDYYNTDSGASVIGNWSIMDNGVYLNNGKTPPLYSAYDRFYMGWLTPEEISTPSNKMLTPLYQGTTAPENTQNQAYLIGANTHNLSGTEPNPSEFFIVEYRKKTGWDSYLPSEGMLIWHIDYSKEAWDANSPNNHDPKNPQNATSHYRMFLKNQTNGQTLGRAITSGNYKPMLWDGTDIKRDLSKITKTNDYMTFSLIVPQIITTGSTNNYLTNLNIPSTAQEINFMGIHLVDDVTISLSDDAHYEIKLSTESTWSKSLVIPQSEGNIANTTLQVRFNPSVTGSLTSELKFQSTNADEIKFNLNGFCINPNAPTAKPGAIGTELQFASTKAGTTKRKAINVKTTDVTGNLTVAISGQHATMFSVSASSITKDNANSANGFNITISYRPTTTGNHTATLTISGGGLNPDKVITLKGTGL